jgi:catechol 2,3-dioxygenase-like lactoylglutathione lyase family enzyme
MKKTVLIILTSLLCVLPAAVLAQDQAIAPKIQSAAEIMTFPMNVFRRFPGDAKPIYDFYGKLLGLKQQETYNLGGNANVARFQIGPTQLKLTAVDSKRKYQQGAVPEATGLRLLTFFFPNRDEVVARFRENGVEVPEFRPIPGSKRSSALLKDPAGQWVELVIAPGEPAAVYDQTEIGLVVSNLEASRKFYREFIGLEELPPVEDPIFSTTKYPYKHGSVIVSLRCFGKPLPADTGSGGIQYVVSNVQSVQNLAQARQVKIDQPINALPGYGLRLVWLEDPDGITNYFAEIAATPAKKQ